MCRFAFISSNSHLPHMRAQTSAFVFRLLQLPLEVTVPDELALPIERIMQKKLPKVISFNIFYKVYTFAWHRAHHAEEIAQRLISLVNYSVHCACTSACICMYAWAHIRVSYGPFFWLGSECVIYAFMMCMLVMRGKLLTPFSCVSKPTCRFCSKWMTSPIRVR